VARRPGRAGHLALGKDGDSIDGKRVVQTLEDVGLNQGVYPEEGQDGRVRLFTYVVKE
jgi:hypothetical protein